ncbi:hypothetical protein ACIBU0_19875 [Streptomyces sp. NPDC049627]|uniref:hypothetical protein n=1 Tax=Streptomyces sp. NPDC049627 TaxID=3365595 RepID=UPI0037A371DB
MPSHDDVAYKEQKVNPPQDLGFHRNAADHLVVTGTCSVCRGWNEYVLVNVKPGTVAKDWPWRRKAGDEKQERQLDCRCPITHPGNDDEYTGCGAWWSVRIPSEEAS